MPATRSSGAPSDRIEIPRDRQQATFVRQHQSPDALMQDQFEEPVQTFLAVIQARAEIGDDLVSPALGGAEGFQQFLLTS